MWWELIKPELDTFCRALSMEQVNALKDIRNLFNYKWKRDKTYNASVINILLLYRNLTNIFAVIGYENIKVVVPEHRLAVERVEYFFFEP